MTRPQHRRQRFKYHYQQKNDPSDDPQGSAQGKTGNIQAYLWETTDGGQAAKQLSDRQQAWLHKNTRQRERHTRKRYATTVVKQLRDEWWADAQRMQVNTPGDPHTTPLLVLCSVHCACSIPRTHHETQSTSQKTNFEKALCVLLCFHCCLAKSYLRMSFVSACPARDSLRMHLPGASCPLF